MLWYKAWIDTRWRFMIGLILLICTALGNVLAYPSVHRLLVLGLQAGSDSALADEIGWIAQLSSNFRGYIWVQVVRHNLCDLWTIFAVLLGADGLLSRRKGVVFTLSLPVSRRRLFTVRAATDVAELLLLALIPMLLIPALAPAVGYSYSATDALVYGTGIFAGGLVYYGLARLLAAAFHDRWRPILITLAAAILAALCRSFIPDLSQLSPAGVMDGNSYFRTGTPAWAGLLIWMAISMAMLYAAARSTEKRDF